jgi:hypothetical protein
MMSLMALAGFAFGSVDSGDALDESEEDFLYEQEGWAQNVAHHNLVDDVNLHDDAVAVSNTATSEISETLDFDRGDMITGFVSGSDQIELEYTASLGVPNVTVTDFADGTGASIALNGVVVADVAGAQGLDPSTVNLIAV